MNYREYEPCKCGKKLVFESREEADKHIARIKAGEYRSDAKRIPTRSHPCNAGFDVWHITSKPGSRLQSLEQELHSVATVGQIIVKFMEDTYNKNGTYKFYSNLVLAGVAEVRPEVRKNVVMQEISRLKKSKDIIGLDEKVPEQKGAVYFTLAKLLDEVTKPEPTKEENVADTAKSEVKVPTQIISTPPTNPFDKVNSQLGELLSKVNGIVTMLVDSSKQQGAIHSKMDAHASLIVEAIKSSEVTLDNEDFENLATAVIKKLPQAVALSQPIDYPNLIEGINARLTAFGEDNSLIYRIREELDDRALKTEDRLRNSIDSLVITKPSDFGTLTEDEKYQRGIKDGIKLAVQMGLILPDA